MQDGTLYQHRFQQINLAQIEQIFVKKHLFISKLANLTIAVAVLCNAFLHTLGYLSQNYFLAVLIYVHLTQPVPFSIPVSSNGKASASSKIHNFAGTHFALSNLKLLHLKHMNRKINYKSQIKKIQKLRPNRISFTVAKKDITLFKSNKTIIVKSGLLSYQS